MTDRRIGSDNSASRSAILDAAFAIMTEGGYAAVTSRAIGERAGLKSKLVHYYFRTMDDLFIALYRQIVDELVEREGVILNSDQPLRALWNLASDPKRVVVTYELVALANHRKALQSEISEYGRRLRDMDARIIERVLEKNGLAKISWLPPISALVFGSLARSLALRDALGVTSGHREATVAIDRIIALLDR